MSEQSGDPVQRGYGVSERIKKLTKFLTVEDSLQLAAGFFKNMRMTGWYEIIGRGNFRDASPRLWIKLHADETAAEQEIRDFCRDSLSHFKIQRYIWFVKEFPMTVTGKLQKFRMQKNRN